MGDDNGDNNGDNNGRDATGDNEWRQQRKMTMEPTMRMMKTMSDGDVRAMVETTGDKDNNKDEDQWRR